MRRLKFAKNQTHGEFRKMGNKALLELLESKGSEMSYKARRKILQIIREREDRKNDSVN